MSASDETLVDPTARSDELARVVCENCWTHFRSWDAWDGITVHHEKDVSWCEAPLKDVFFNQVYGARFRYSAAERRIRTLVGHAQRRGVPLIWRVGPDSAPGNLGLLLEKAGLQYADDGLAMAMDLSLLEQVEAKHIAIEPVRDDAGMRTWTEIGIEAFGSPPEFTDPVYEMHRAMGFGPDEPHQHFLARIDGTDVAMATLTTHCGVAALQSLGTREAWRQRGAGTALTHHVMREGRSRGYKTGVLQASALGQGVYRKLGFREVGRVYEYVLEA